MGLVTCSKCKKIYDYGKYSGICPKCARYNSENTAAEEHQEFHDRYDGGYSHTPQDNHHSYHRKYDENPNLHGSETEVLKETQGKKNKNFKLLIGILIFIVAVNVVLPILFGIFFSIFQIF